MPWFAAAAPYIATAAAAGVSAYSSYQQGKSQEAMAKYNAAVAQQDAKQKEQEGKLAAKEIREQKRRIIATQTAGTAKSGLMSEGTPLLVNIQTAADEEYNALMTSYNAGIQANRFRSDAKLSKMQGKSARQAGNLGAGASLFSGASNMAQYRMQQRYGG